jgi:hypothetical protein
MSERGMALKDERAFLHHEGAYRLGVVATFDCSGESI